MSYDFILNAFVTLFVIIEPIALAPVFLAVTVGFSQAQRRQVAWRASFIAFLILTMCAFFGQPLLKFLGISLPAFRISGGILLFWISCQMIFGNRAAADEKDARDAVTKDHVENIAAFPLAIPLLAGPGAITAVLLLATQAAGAGSPFRAEAMPHMGALIGVLAVITMMCWFAMLIATPTAKALGNMGNVVIARLLGVILAALSVQFVIDGAMPIFRGLA